MEEGIEFAIKESNYSRIGFLFFIFKNTFQKVFQKMLTKKFKGVIK